MDDAQSGKLERLERRVRREKRNVFARLTPVYAASRSQAERFLKYGGGLSTIEWRVLWDLYEVGPMSIREMAKIQRTDHSKLSRALPAMRGKGYVLIERDKTDGRQTVVSMTDAGLDAYEKAAPFMKCRRQSLRNEFSEDEIQAFVGFIDRFERFLSRPVEDFLNEDPIE